MRISDWSSDVCSSDLVETGNDQRIPCSQHLERLRQLLAIALYATRGFVEHLRSPSGDKCRSLCIESLAVCRSEEHTSELQSLMRISYAVFCLKKKIKQIDHILIPADTIENSTYSNKY